MFSHWISLCRRQLENRSAGAVRFLKPWFLVQLSVWDCSKGTRLPLSRRVKSGIRVTAQLASAGRALRVQGSLLCFFPLCFLCCSARWWLRCLLFCCSCVLEGLSCSLQRCNERKPVLAV